MDCTNAHIIPFVVHFSSALIALLIAVITFKMFPKSNAEAEGPVKQKGLGELKVKVGGAFAGFIITFLILVILTPDINRTLISNSCNSSLERWTFSIPVYVIDEETGKAYEDLSELKKQIKIEVKESFWSIAEGNRLYLNYPVNRDNITDRLKSISLEIQENISEDGSKRIIHEIGRLDISQKKHMLVFHEDTKLIEVGFPMVIKRMTFENNAYVSEASSDNVSSMFQNLPEPSVLSAEEQQ